MQQNMSGMCKKDSSHINKAKKQESHKSQHIKEAMPGSELWTEGLICAFEYVGFHKKSIKSRSYSKIHSANKMDGVNIKKEVPTNGVTDASSPKADGKKLMEFTSLSGLVGPCVAHLDDEKEVPTNGVTDASSPKADGKKLMESTSLSGLVGPRVAHLDDEIDCRQSHSGHLYTSERLAGSHWVPIGWARISELVQTVQVDAGWASLQFDTLDDEDDLTVADLAAPYWERPGGPRWWCHVTAGHPFIDAWLRNAQWLHPAISIALRDESRLISDRMKHLLYEVPVRVAGGLLFELLGQSVGDPFVDEADIPIVLRSWQAHNFLITALHVKGSTSSLNVLGITEVLELLFVGGNYSPRSVHEVIAHLACRLARWDDRLFRKSIFGAADEVELKFVNRRNQEDMNLFSIILNQEIRRLSRQVIRVKWSLHAREEIIFELLQHLRGNAARSLLEGIQKSTREMIDEQEAVRGRLFTIQDVIQSTVRAWLQDRSLRVTHNLAVFGGCGLVLSIFTGLFGINVDGIPGARTPYAFVLFSAILFFLGIVLIAVGLLYFGLKQPITEKQVEVRKLELQELVKMFQHEAETHAQVYNKVSRDNLPPTTSDKFPEDADYILIN